jgi:hypothetical protein
MNENVFPDPVSGTAKRQVATRNEKLQKVGMPL